VVGQDVRNFWRLANETILCNINVIIYFLSDMNYFKKQNEWSAASLDLCICFVEERDLQADVHLLCYSCSTISCGNLRKAHSKSRKYDKRNRQLRSIAWYQTRRIQSNGSADMG
jgi:hypothetical protein